MSTTANSTVIVPAPDNAVYLAPSGELQLDVRIDSETVWLTQAQMSKLFGSSQRMMSHHINNVFSEGELDRRKNIQKVYIDRSKKPITLHNLDVIISVGYRVKSPNGIHFRKWATRTLRQRLLSEHHQRQMERGRLETLGALASHVLTSDEARALLSIISRFSNSWQILRQFDEGLLPERPTAPTRRAKRLTLRHAHAAIAALKAELMRKGEAGDLLGLEHSDGLAGILGNIEQTFDGKALYPSVEERAAALLYFVIKDHPFADGNKRIGSLLFVHFLDKNGCLFRPDGTQRFDQKRIGRPGSAGRGKRSEAKGHRQRLILAMLS